MRIEIAAALAAALSLCACASVTRGTTEQVTFDSDPSGAEMRSTVDNPCGAGGCQPRDAADGSAAAYRETPDKAEPLGPGPACITPCTVEVKRNQELTVTFTKPGYQPETAHLGTKMVGQGAVGVAGNAIIGGVAGVVIDSATGAALDHYPNPMKVILKPVSRPAPVAPPRPALPTQRAPGTS